MIIVKATKDSEAGVMPSEELLTEMGKFNEELVKAGVLLAGEGLQPSSKSARVKFSGTTRTLINGPFAETRALPATGSSRRNRRKKQSHASSAARIRRVKAKKARLKFAESSKRRILVLSSLLN